MTEAGTADGGDEQGPVGRFELRSSLAAEHGELMAPDKDLKILGGIAAGELGESLHGAAQRQVRSRGSTGVGQRSAAVASRVRCESPSSSALSECLHPTGPSQSNGSVSFP